MGESIGYHSPAVYLPQTSTLSAHLFQQPARDRSESLLASTGVEVDKSSDQAVGMRIEAAAAVAENFDETGANSDQQAAERQFDRRSEVVAQELAGDAEKLDSLAEESKKIAAVASASEMVGTDEALRRLDQDRDGRIDLLEVQHAFRAEDDGSTYEALSLYRKTVSLTTDEENAVTEDKKLFAEEAATEKVFGEDLAEEHKFFDEEDAETKKIFGDQAEEGEAAVDGEPDEQEDDGVEVIV